VPFRLPRSHNFDHSKRWSKSDTLAQQFGYSAITKQRGLQKASLA